MDKYVDSWLTGLSESTKKNYLKDWSKWLEFIGMTPTEQIEKRLKDLTSQDLTERTFFEQKFRAYKEHLEKNTELKAISVKTKLRTVASFFGRNSLPLNLKRGDWDSTLPTEAKHRFKLTLDDVKAMYAHANLRDKALLLNLAQSGFSEVDVTELKIEDIKTLYEMPQTEHYFIEKPRERQVKCVSTVEVQTLEAMILRNGFVKTVDGSLGSANNPPTLWNLPKILVKNKKMFLLPVRSTERLGYFNVRSTERSL